MWSEGLQYDYKQLPRERTPPWSHPSDVYHGVVYFAPERPPWLDKRPPQLARTNYSVVDYRECDEGCCSSCDGRSGPPHRGSDSGYRWAGDAHSLRRPPEYRGVRNGFRRKSICSSRYSRERSPHQRSSPFFGGSRVGWEESQHSRSGYHLSHSRYYPRRSRMHSVIQPQNNIEESSTQSSETSRDTVSSRSSAISSPKVLDKRSRLTEKELAEATIKWAFIQALKTSRDTSFSSSPTVPSSSILDKLSQLTEKELTEAAMKWASTQALKTSRDMSPSSSPAVCLYEVLDKPSKLTEKDLAKAASKWANEKPAKSGENNLAEISDFEVRSMTPLCINLTKETESNTRDSTEFCEVGQFNSRSKAFASKLKEIEQVYRQECENFVRIVKLLIEKDSSLEKSIHFAMKQNLHEIGERHVEEFKHFITSYDNSTQGFGGPS